MQGKHRIRKKVGEDSDPNMLCQRGVPKGTPFSFRNSCERDWGGKSGIINRKREKGEITALSDLLNVKKGPSLQRLEI